MLLWKLLDGCGFGRSHVLFERVERELNSYRKVPGQPIATELANMRRLCAQYIRVDRGTHVSDKPSLTQPSLRDCGRLRLGGRRLHHDGRRKRLRHRCTQTHED